MRLQTRFAPCALADIGRCAAPCAGRIDPERYGELVRDLISSLTHPDGLLEALEARMRWLAERERFEEAAAARDRLRALTEALARRRLDSWLLRPGRLEFLDPTGARIRFRDGGLVRDGAEPIGYPYPRERADEVAAVRAWLQHNDVRVLSADPAPVEPAEGRLLDTLRSRLREAAAGTRRGASAGGG